MTGVLLCEPFCYRPWEIARLTDSQIRWIAEESVRQSKRLKEIESDHESSSSMSGRRAGEPTLDDMPDVMPPERIAELDRRFGKKG